jgi:ketosteroid isomerase-like protein
MKLAVQILLSLLFLSSLSPAADRDPKVLMDADRAFAKATAERGAEGWMEFMAPNAVDLTRETLASLDQIRAEMISEFKLPSIHLTWQPDKAEFLGNGSVGYTIGHYEVRYNGEDGKPVSRKGTYLTIWQQQADGTWKVRADIGSPDPPSEQMTSH